MKTMSLLAAVLALGLTFGVGDADAAKRLGGGKSAGMQREMTVDKTPGATPAQTPTAPMAATTPAQGAMAAAPAAAAAQSKRSWMGPLAGIAAGIGLAALASHFGFGDELASMMMIGLLVMVAVAVIGFIMRRRAAARNPAMAAAGAGAGAGGMFRTGQTDAPASRGFDVSMPPATPASGASTGSSLFGSSFGASPAPTSAIGAGLSAAPTQAPVIPAGFDVEAFVRNAKVNFIRLQAANDSANLDELREVTTPEMFAELKMDIVERGAAAQQTEVVTLGADVLEVVEDAARYVVSVRFTGQIREDKFAAPEAFDEVWHLTKSRTGSGGWLLSGIQQAR
ncbi:MAG: preprotein translocase subunit Tim44 [Burkholderiales bacterium RIFOXYC12_FULL_65_23]|uniref:Tim44 domain-containing protein n=1 Tax=Malikia spinosa TaxID=86180 RepID=UPI0008C3D16E|nr:MAG: preprotein translocase subunit Tim44 [Burkholderiales bacterium RIFOXYC12_FULL_65_23]